MGERNSYSKTDPDATFMRMKDDHMRNGQLKAGYNIQIGTENQYILSYNIYPKPTDTTTLPHFLDSFKEQYDIFPENLIADAGYGSEENYEYIESVGINGYVKYNMFHKENKKKFKKDIYRVENLKYNSEEDTYLCPGDKKLFYIFDQEYVTINGYRSMRKIYECENCTGCIQRESCHKSKYNRRIKVSSRLNELKKKARDNLDSEKGLKYRSRRCVDVEPVFAQIKHNRNYKRFTRRGNDGVSSEWGLLSIVHNLTKMHKEQNAR